MNSAQLWSRFKTHLNVNPTVGLTVDISRMNFPDSYFTTMEPLIKEALTAMAALEHGAIANPDEQRMVGHYWLRNPALAPNRQIQDEITTALAGIKSFAEKVHGGQIRPEKSKLFKNILLIGIGGSALGPQFVTHALSTPRDRMRAWFFDNTDPNGMDKVLGQIGEGLLETLTIVISKSGATKETRNGMLEVKAAYERVGSNFARHAVAVTSHGSELDATAKDWLARFPMWDWVGGRTSELSAVGLLPAALQGFDIDALLAGAQAMDQVTRNDNPLKNPAALLALMWYHAGKGKGQKDMVVLPYKDRLELFSRYLQQLVMESLGKEKDLAGRIVHQGLAVYGNKGSTDQHAYVQQLREGINNFFVVFIEVLQDRAGRSMEVDPGVTSGDYLSGFLQGTRRALFENDRESITITLNAVTPESVGQLIALFERAVGLYASLIYVNAYHQPGVEAGKKAAVAVIALQLRVLDHLSHHKGQPFTVEQIAQALGEPAESEVIFKILQHVAANPDHGVTAHPGATVFDTRYEA
ncbi:MAG: glucose-6-phosphate isomerase [Nitrospirota bacterium]